MFFKKNFEGNVYEQFLEEIRVREEWANVLPPEYSKTVTEEGEGAHEEIETSEERDHLDHSQQDLLHRADVDHVLDLQRSHDGVKIRLDKLFCLVETEIEKRCNLLLIKELYCSMKFFVTRQRCGTVWCFLSIWWFHTFWVRKVWKLKSVLKHWTEVSERDWTRDTTWES